MREHPRHATQINGGLLHELLTAMHVRDLFICAHSREMILRAIDGSERAGGGR
jgi:hypothetical protein